MIAEGEVLVRLLVAVVIGALIGFQRESESVPAGFRTHMLICLGSTLFTIVSIEFIGAQDPSRIAAGIVTGIGFLGAGAIFRADDKVHGLTTAADLWVLSAIGIAIGLGFFYSAIFTAVVVVIILTLKRIFSAKN
ncbi:MAG TPA: MgtC/SapB family protein [archaeon]|nr:MgtC/SapB family protein [archaeon]